LDRRSFLKLLGAAPLVIAAPSLAEIWIPPQQEIIVPPKLTETIAEGNTVCGWVVPVNIAEDVYDMLNDQDLPHMRQQFGVDAISYFPPKTPILLLAGNVSFDSRIKLNETTSVTTHSRSYTIMDNKGMIHTVQGEQDHYSNSFRRMQPINRRFKWRGTSNMPEGGTEFRILQSWDDSSRMVLQ